LIGLPLVERCHGFVDGVIDVEQGRCADDLDDFVDVFIDVGDFEAAALFARGLAEVQQDAEPGAVDIPEIFKVRHDYDLALVEKGAYLVENGFDVCGIEITGKPDELRVAAAFDFFARHFDV
jgi:hypothetical protein